MAWKQRKKLQSVDRIFADPARPVGDFSFGEDTAEVFEDMLDRSVPGYREIQRMIAELAADFAVDGTHVYDLGCSTGTTLRLLDQLPQEVRLIGVDSSEAMLAKAEKQFAAAPLAHAHTLLERNLNAELPVENASLVVMSLTLQFVRPIYRERILRDIREGLNDGGALILIEKVLGEESLLNRCYIQHYHEFKLRNGYTEMEIARKREALENVLIPYRLKEHEEMLHHAGFRAVDVFFKWYNFAGIIALR
jgi:tRNA (cmo5U34)-methyltransferase